MIVFSFVYKILESVILGERFHAIDFIISLPIAKAYPASWFCIVLLILYVAYYLIYKNIHNHQYTILAVFCIFLMGVLFLLRCGSWWYCSIMAFPLGVANRNGQLLPIINSKIIVAVNAILFCAIYAYVLKYHVYDGILFAIIKVYQSVAVCLIYQAFSNKMIIRSKVLSLLGKNSLIIYLAHPIWLMVGRDVLKIAVSWWYSIAIIVLSLATSMIYQKIRSTFNETFGEEGFK